MLKKFASDALGISDIGMIIRPEDYKKVDSDDYIMHEDGETIYFLIKSKSDEYCFTNKALIHIDGENAISKKRNLYRYDYYLNNISDVSLETAGTIDLDVEIKFTIGQKSFSIDVDKKQLEQLKDLYKALIKISEITRDNQILLNYTNESIRTTATLMSSNRIEGINLEENFKNINEYVFEWLVSSKNKYSVRDFGYVFEKYINN
ncbi:PH domain-containing protein [Clostridium sp. CCUG 7971]|uniref:PH domain-containing protein n=1 Tax=Clostridium sp. CCUG 7971 TaxID=2811414 RepID=UPI001ABAFE4F|nr:PH domain-containing protein [Clostridium sp. CCUG 7971]MBO3446031.1 PH domain-containing protein [Clostridium sp. CCUG 7971]